MKLGFALVQTNEIDCFCGLKLWLEKETLNRFLHRHWSGTCNRSSVQILTFGGTREFYQARLGLLMQGLGFSMGVMDQGSGVVIFRGVPKQ